MSFFNRIKKKGQGTTEYVLIIGAIAVLGYFIVRMVLMQRLQSAAEGAGSQIETFASD